MKNPMRLRRFLSYSSYWISKALLSPLMLWELAPEIAAQIIRNGGDYILALKGNQGNLYKGVKTFFEQAIAHDWEGIDYSYFRVFHSPKSG